MLQSIYSGAMGARAQQTRMDVIASNLANVNTIGYKPQGTQFRDALYFAKQDPSNYNSTNNLQSGTGVLLSSALRDFTQGTTNVTGNTLDVCLNGEGFLAVQSQSGETAYTRDGTLALSQEEDGQYLVTIQGMYILDENGQRIKIQGAMSEVVIGQDGSISQGANDPYAKLGLYTFTNLNGLQAIGNSQYMPTVNSGEAQQAQGLTLQQGALESSGTNMALEMTRVIRSQRALSFAARCITTADTMEAQTNMIRG